VTANTASILSGVNLNLNTSASTKTTNIGTGSTTGLVTVGGGSNKVNIGSPLEVSGDLVISTSPPTVTSGLGTSPTVTAPSTAAFRIVAGASGTPATSLVLALASAADGWVCTVTDQTTPTTVGHETGNTVSSATFTFNAAPSNSDVLLFQCGGF
jgi:hypothetical protein